MAFNLDKDIDVAMENILATEGRMARSAIEKRKGKIKQALVAVMGPVYATANRWREYELAEAQRKRDEKNGLYR